MRDPEDNSSLDMFGEIIEPPVVVPVPTLSVVCPEAEASETGPLDAAARQRKVRARRKKLADEQGLKSVWLLKDDREVLAQALGLLDRVNDGQTSGAARHELLQKLVPGAEFPVVEFIDRPYQAFWDSRVAGTSIEGVKLFCLELTAEELDEVSAAICTHWRANEKFDNGWRARVAQSLWRRWVMLRHGYSYAEDDPQWGLAAVELETQQARKEAKYAHWGDPGSAPFMLTRRDRSYLTQALDYYEYANFSAERGESFERTNLQKLYGRLSEDHKGSDKAEFPAREKRQAFKHEEMHKLYYAQKDRQLAGLQKQLDAAQRECQLLESERNGALSAYRVLEDRLRAAGMSTDYRESPLRPGI